MKINSKMIAFSDDGETGEKIVDVPLTGPIDRNRGCFFPILFSHEKRPRWGTVPPFLVGSRCSCLLLNTKKKIVELHVFLFCSAAPNPCLFPLLSTFLSHHISLLS